MIKSGMTDSKHLTEENMYTKIQMMGQEMKKSPQTAESWCTFCLPDNCFFMISLFATVDTVTQIKTTTHVYNENVLAGHRY